MRRLVPFLAVLLVAAGCASRPRSNPFDPANPGTSGRPANLRAVAGPSYVELRWQSAGSIPGAGYQVFRRVEGETAFQAISVTLPSTASLFFDYAADNGKRHDYRLYFVLDNKISGLPAEDHATPGDDRVWASDLSARVVRQLSADGRQIASSFGTFYGPTFIAFDARNRWMWVSDTYDGSVRSVDINQTTRITLAGMSEPVSLAIDSTRDEIWICDQARDAVYHYTLSGQVRSPSSIGPINTPIGIAVDPSDGSLWVCERGGDRVRHFQRDGTPDGAVTLFAPSRVAVDSVGRDAWVTSFDGARVVRISPGVVAQDTIPMSGPIGIAIDHRRGRIWVADARAGQVVALRRSGLVEFRVSGLPRVRELTVNFETGECWATVPGDGSVVRISPAGLLLERAVGFRDPYGIAIDPGDAGR